MRKKREQLNILSNSYLERNVLQLKGINLYEIKASKMLRAEYLENLQYLKRTLPNVAGSSVIYNGETMGSVINIREI